MSIKFLILLSCFFVALATAAAATAKTSASHHSPSPPPPSPQHQQNRIVNGFDDKKQPHDLSALMLEMTPVQHAYVTGTDTTGSLRLHLVESASDLPDMQTNFSVLATAAFVPSGNITGWNVFNVTGSPWRLDSVSNVDAFDLRGYNNNNNNNNNNGAQQQKQQEENKNVIISNASLVYAAAGMLEGFLMSQEIIDAYKNTFFMTTPAPVQQWIKTNVEFVSDFLCNPCVERSRVLQNATMPFVVQLCKLRFQMEGLVLGINSPEHTRPWNMGPKNWTMEDAWLNLMSAEIMDLFVYCNVSMMMSGDDPRRKNNNSNNNVGASSSSTSSSSSSSSYFSPFPKKGLLFSDNDDDDDPLVFEHCSALIKLTDDDLYFGHDVWSQFNMMIRKFGKYEFETTVLLSGYPGLLACSQDDFYEIVGSSTTNNNNKKKSKRLGVMETTFTQGNKELTWKYTTPWTVPEFMRVQIANYVADDGLRWSHLFNELQSGSYCNTYMVIDATKISRNTSNNKMTLDDGALFVFDQMPGNFSMYSDFTPVLRKEKYFASYNIPAHHAIRVLSGSVANEKKYGPFFSYTETARARIFRHNQSHVTDLASFEALMRSNKFTTDPFSRIPECFNCTPPYNPTLAVAARADLADPSATFGNLSQYMQGFFMPSAFGALDCKASAWSFFVESYDNEQKKENVTTTTTISVKAHAQMGPTTYDGNPPMQLSKLAPNLQMQMTGTYQGKFDFSWYMFGAESPRPFIKQSSSSSSSSSHKISADPPSSSHPVVCNNKFVNVPSDLWNLYTKIGVGLGAGLVFVLVLVSVRHFHCNKDGGRKEEEAGKPTEETNLLQG